VSDDGQVCDSTIRDADGRELRCDASASHDMHSCEHPDVPGRRDSWTTSYADRQKEHAGGTQAD
jgi:hypothetical protein